MAPKEKQRTNSKPDLAAVPSKAGITDLQQTLKEWIQKAFESRHLEPDELNPFGGSFQEIVERQWHFRENTLLVKSLELLQQAGLVEKSTGPDEFISEWTSLKAGPD